jgi:DNA-binding SARP family transcriptional activator
MADGVAVRLLGPVRLVTNSGTEVAFRGHVARLLAWLALHPDRAWTVEDLAARLWPDGSPPTARTAIQGHVSRLRRTLTTVDGVGIESTGGGYALRSRPGAVDVHRFRGAVRRGRGRRAGRARRVRRRRPPGRGARAVVGGRARRAADRSAPRTGGPAPSTTSARDAEEGLAEALVGAGRLDRALALLGRLVNEEPLRERRWALAHDRADPRRPAGRRIARLPPGGGDCWSSAPGLDPGPELQRLETAILLQDPALDTAAGSPRRARRPPR